jgi:glycosyltransferase involved in cell wall biosynthesis
MVTLVMPVWKPNPGWFRQAVRSALDERGCEIELIIVDDGSPEPVAELLGDIDDARLRIVMAQHGGISHARNVGIVEARGEAIRFIDADDLVEPGSTARLLELSRPDGAIAYGSTLVCDPELRPEKLVGSTAEGDALTACLLGGFFVYITAMLFPRKVIAAAGEFDSRFEPSEDYDFVLRALEHAPVRGESFVAARYRRHGDSITARRRVEETGSQEAFERVFERRPDLRGTAVEHAARAHMHVGAATRLMHAGRYAGTARELALALRRSPVSAAPEVAAVLRSFPRLAVRRAMAAHGD